MYDETWKGRKEFPEVDFDRIKIPHKKKFVLAPNWRARFVFDFILPPPSWLFKARQQRLASDDVRLVDMGLTPEWVVWQVQTYWTVARFFHQAGLQVMLRPFNTARPYSFPLIEKVMRKKPRASVEEVTPALDWSKVRYIKRWIEEVSPEALALNVPTSTPGPVTADQSAVLHLVSNPLAPEMLKTSWAWLKGFPFIR